MPKWKAGDNRFYCSWDWKCDFSHVNIDVVVKHEDEEHNATFVQSMEEKAEGS